MNATFRIFPRNRDPMSTKSGHKLLRITHRRDHVSKIITIENCMQCPHSYPYDVHVGKMMLLCGEGKIVRDRPSTDVRVIHQQKIIPDWCPLKDA